MELVKALLIPACMIIGTCSQAQFFNASHVPTESKIILAGLHPNLGSQVSWTKEPEGYEASFMLHNKAHYVLFDFQGSFIAEASVINRRSLPKRVRRHLRKTYHTFHIEQSVVIKSSGGDLQYQARVSRGEEE